MASRYTNTLKRMTFTYLNVPDTRSIQVESDFIIGNVLEEASSLPRYQYMMLTDAYSSATRSYGSSDATAHTSFYDDQLNKVTLNNFRYDSVLFPYGLRYGNQEQDVPEDEETLWGILNENFEESELAPTLSTTYSRYNRVSDVYLISKVIRNIHKKCLGGNDEDLYDGIEFGADGLSSGDNYITDTYFYPGNDYRVAKYPTKALFEYPDPPDSYIPNLIETKLLAEHPSDFESVFQAGNTIFYPVTLGIYDIGLRFNYRCPAVQEYWKQLIVRQAIEKEDDANFFADNVAFMANQVSITSGRQYILPRSSYASDTAFYQAIGQNLADVYISVFEDANERLVALGYDPVTFSINGLLYARNAYAKATSDRIMQAGATWSNQGVSTPLVVGGTWERYLQASEVALHSSTLTTYEERDQWAVYAFTGFVSEGEGPRNTYDDAYLYRLQLYCSLIGTDTFYLYAGPNYNASQIKTCLYDYPMGNPVDSAPYLDTNYVLDDTTISVWKRRFDKAVVVFNPNAAGGTPNDGILTADHIWIEDYKEREELHNGSFLSVSAQEKNCSLDLSSSESCSVYFNGRVFLFEEVDGKIKATDTTSTNDFTFTCLPMYEGESFVQNNDYYVTWDGKDGTKHLINLYKAEFSSSLKTYYAVDRRGTGTFPITQENQVWSFSKK